MATKTLAIQKRPHAFSSVGALDLLWFGSELSSV